MEIRYNGRESANQDAAPGQVRNLCDDVMSVIENNGEVTLPVSCPSERLITKRQLQFVLLLVGGLLFVVWLDRRATWPATSGI